MKKIAVLLSGCGVYDGSEIHEAVLTLLSLNEHGATYQVFAPDKNQYHVINHLTGNEMPETRNVLIESARIARGQAKPLNDYKAAEFDGMIIPGGFGAAKNLSTWAFKGPDAEIDSEVKRAIRETVAAGKPLAALCIAPTAVAKALEGTDYHPELTVGSDTGSTSYEIASISEGLEKSGAKAVNKSIREIHTDKKLKIITAPCYMMEASISDIKKNIDMAVNQLLTIAENAD
jgi:enhancing lycopene biosynthesis protein 2